jgi:hypothetical protein
MDGNQQSAIRGRLYGLVEGRLQEHISAAERDPESYKDMTEAEHVEQIIDRLYEGGVPGQPQDEPPPPTPEPDPQEPEADAEAE